MSSYLDIAGMLSLRDTTRGHEQVRVAILDGPADLTHPCFHEANVKRIHSYWLDERPVEPYFAEHATHVMSVIFGQKPGGIEGIAPQCQGLNIAVGYELDSLLSPLNLARAIDLAFAEDANIIHVSVCIPSTSGHADGMLASSIQRCLDNNVMVIAPVGNDNGQKWCLPAAVEGVLAVGALNDKGRPFAFNNSGGIYQRQGILALGDKIVGAAPGGKTSIHRGTSCAAPIVTGTAALLMSQQFTQGGRVNAQSIRHALIKSGKPCPPADGDDDPGRCLAGVLDVPGAVRLLAGRSAPTTRRSPYKISRAHEPAVFGSPVRPPVQCTRSQQSVPRRAVAAALVGAGAARLSAAQRSPSDRAVAPSSYPGAGRLVFAIGQIGFDFGTEARRDTFRQQMQSVIGPVLGPDGQVVLPDRANRAELINQGYRPMPVNPYSPEQLVAYLQKHPDEVTSLIWTLNLDRTPVYVIEASGPYGSDVGRLLVEMLAGQSLPRDSTTFVERTSMAALLANRTVRLFSGQVLPVIEVDGTRGIYAWTTADLVNAAMPAVIGVSGLPDTPEVRAAVARTLRAILNKIYYEFRNLGVTAPDRALNFAATNIVQLADVLGSVLGDRDDAKHVKPRMLQTIDVLKSPYCRVDSDCWDVRLKFFDPDDTHRAFKVFRFTLDVSDKLPVTLGDVVEWASI